MSKKIIRILYQCVFFYELTKFVSVFVNVFVIEYEKLYYIAGITLIICILCRLNHAIDLTNIIY